MNAVMNKSVFLRSLILAFNVSHGTPYLQKSALTSSSSMPYHVRALGSEDELVNHKSFGPGSTFAGAAVLTPCP